MKIRLFGRAMAAVLLAGSVLAVGAAQAADPVRLKVGIRGGISEPIWEIVAILIVLVTSVQFGCEWLSRRVDHRR